MLLHHIAAATEHVLQPRMNHVAITPYVRVDANMIAAECECCDCAFRIAQKLTEAHILTLIAPSSLASQLCHRLRLSSRQEGGFLMRSELGRRSDPGTGRDDKLGKGQLHKLQVRA